MKSPHFFTVPSKDMPSKDMPSRDMPEGGPSGASLPACSFAGLARTYFCACLVILFTSSCAPQFERQNSPRELGGAKEQRVHLGPPTPLQDSILDQNALLTLNQVLLPAPEYLGDARGRSVENFEKRLSNKLRSLAGVEVVEKEIFDSASAKPYILKVRFFRLEDRVGSRIGSSSPARVHFDIELRRGASFSDSKSVWKADFLKSEGPLTDNLLGASNRAEVVRELGPGYHTKDELLDYAFSLVAKRLQQIKKDALLK